MFVVCELFRESFAGQTAGESESHFQPRFRFAQSLFLSGNEFFINLKTSATKIMQH